jgi:hypothetical protein
VQVIQTTKPQTQAQLDSATPTFSHNQEYILDKSHFEECYDQSRQPVSGARAYLKAACLLVAGLALVFSPLDRIFVFFLLGLGIIEALSVRYQRAWWLLRQMMSKAAGNQVELLIDMQGVHSRSQFVNSHILWADVSNIEETDRGFVLLHPAGRGYVSKRCLSDAACAFIAAKGKTLESQQTERH